MLAINRHDTANKSIASRDRSWPLLITYCAILIIPMSPCTVILLCGSHMCMFQREDICFRHICSVVCLQHVCFLATWMVVYIIPDVSGRVRRMRVYDKQLIHKLNFDASFADTRKREHGGEDQPSLLQQLQENQSDVDIRTQSRPALTGSRRFSLLQHLENVEPDDAKKQTTQSEGDTRGHASTISTGSRRSLLDHLANVESNDAKNKTTQHKDYLAMGRSSIASPSNRRFSFLKHLEDMQPEHFHRNESNQY